MGLFDKSCPLEKAYLRVYGIQPPKKWKKEDCATCSYLENNKCNYTQITARKGDPFKRGRPVLAKRSSLSRPVEARREAEKEALKQAGFSPEEEKEYWAVSAEYDSLWENAHEEQKQDILDCLDQLRVKLETGLSPLRANEQVKEWLRVREEFRRR